MDSSSIRNFDDLLIRYGEFGTYQRWMYLLFAIPYVLTSMQLMGWVFVGAEIPHRCLLHNETIDASFSTDEEGLYTCSDDQGVACTQHIYDTSVIEDSVVKEWNLVCDHSEMRARVSSAPMFGYLFGSLVFGSLSDKMGRKITFLVASAILFLSSCFAAAAPEYYCFLIARAVIGFAIPGVETACFVMGMELVGPSKRTLAGILCWFFESLGLLLTVALAYLLNSNWRLLQAVYSIPLILFIPYIWITPESPRWLMSHKRYEDANETIVKIMKSNGIPNSEKGLVTSILKNIAENETTKEVTSQHYSYFDLCRYPGLRIKTLILNWLWIVTSSLYYVLLLDQRELSTNPYIGFLITVSVQIPGYIYVIYSLEHPFFGRKRSLIVMLLLTGFSLSSHPFLQTYKWARVAVSIIGRFAANCSYTILTLYSTEQYPTVVRGIGISFSLTVSRIGSILAPYILLIGSYAPLVFGLGAILGGMLTCLLPETLGRHLPDTIEESEKILLSLPCQNPYVKNEQNDKSSDDDAE